MPSDRWKPMPCSTKTQRWTQVGAPSASNLRAAVALNGDASFCGAMIFCIFWMTFAWSPRRSSLGTWGVLQVNRAALLVVDCSDLRFSSSEVTEA